MRVTSLGLEDFRSYERAELEFAPGITVFVGRNGQGKTNLVEAIGYVATHSSHRVANDAPLVRQGAERAIIRCGIHHQDRDAFIELELNPGKANRARINRSNVTKARDALGYLRTVLFAPEDLALVKGDPSDRRRFLDDAAIQLAPKYAGVKADYERVLKQRNALLKSSRQARRHAIGDVIATLEVWDAQLIAFGTQVTTQRAELIRRLLPLARDEYTNVSDGGGELRLTYVTKLAAEIDLEEADAVHTGMAALIEERRNDELDRGVTLVGPHRDDVAIELAGLPAKGYASHGESWSAALAMRLASFHLLRAEFDGDPVLILDDVFAELDATRRRKLAQSVHTAEQVLITAAVAEDIPAELSGARFEVVEGTVSSS